ncbi:beta-propeller domain-containing protein [Sorangium sp. So ce1335]|uniref:beta-propeller domain-containing protein n=1 Tax=Sorangium sp. So ce1335 TaxID=3133335 RepID=UPI003F5DB58F
MTILLSRIHVSWLVLAATAAWAGVTGCQVELTGTGPETTPPRGADFISANPGDNADRSMPGASEHGSSGAGGGPGSAPDDAAGDGDAARAIAEADIIQVQDGKLYALSQYAGLSVVDISRRDRLTLLGRYHARGIPFEMVLRDGVAYAMFSSWGERLADDASGSYGFGQVSRIEALDVSDPAEIRPLGSFNLPGTLSDARVVGDVLYAVSFENGACFRCAGAPNTTITSLSVGDPAHIGVVEQLRFPDDDFATHGWRRSVIASEDRMVVAGVTWDGTSEGHSTLKVVDISDPAGHLAAGASVEVAGQIQSRWQMDEHEGVLRVISQPGIWGAEAMPAVQTFSVVSSDEIAPLGYTELRLPRPERLRSVRFDGDRAYAITAEQIDPLFTIDLSDPANPAQLGELEMPGWVVHMEPRGDRLFAVGFDADAGEGPLHVSLLDVSDLARPTMLGRVHFGRSWGDFDFAEDQDRIHKAFTLLDDLGTILVPYSGREHGGCGPYESGVQLVDFTRDTLTKRGAAPVRGRARRAFVHDDRLLAVSDLEVGTFNIDDRDIPVEAAHLTLETAVANAVVTGDLVVRLSADRRSSRATLEVAPAADPGRADPLGALDLAELSSASQDGCHEAGLSEARLFAHGQAAYLLWPSYNRWTTGLAVIDLSVPSAPRIASRLELPFSGGALYPYRYYGPLVGAGDTVVQAGSTLVIRTTQEHRDPQGSTAPQPQRGWLEILDLSSPTSPAHRSVALPEGQGYPGLLIDGTTVVTSHWVPLPDDPTRARFYLDRVDVEDPSSPVVSPPVNVPGSLLAFDSDARRLLTVDYEALEFEVTAREACYGAVAHHERFVPKDRNRRDGPGTCRGTRRAFKLVDVGDDAARPRDERAIDDSMAITQAFAGEDRVFMLTYGDRTASDDGGHDYRYLGLVVSGLAEGRLDVAAYEAEEMGHVVPLLADGTRLVVAGAEPPAISVLDATDLDALTFERKGELSSYAYRDPVTVSGDRALCSLGLYGIEVVDLGD